MSLPLDVTLPDFTTMAVAALRETSVIFAAVIGSLVLREGFGAPRIAGAVLVACGIAALRV